VSHASTSTDFGSGSYQERPTILRHWVVLAATLMSALLYLDRFCVSFAERYIKEDLGLSDQAMGYFFFAFFFPYALAQVPGGWFSDRFGARIMMVIYIVSWSIFTGLTGLASGLFFLLAMRFGFGIAQAGAYPTSAGLLSKWVPFSNRGTASSIVAFGGRAGGAVAPLLTAYLMVLFVPTTVSSLLTVEQLMPGETGVLAAKLVPPSDSRSAPGEGTDSSGNEAKPAKPNLAAERVWQFIPAESQQALLDVAREYESFHSARDELRANAEHHEQLGEYAAANEQRVLASAPFVTSDANRETIVSGLNAVLAEPGLYDRVAFGEFNIAHEAQSLLKRQEAGETLTGDQLQRLNRLLLEAAFPGEIGKIYVDGWRPMMYAYSLLGLGVAGFFWFVFRNRPEEHPLCNQAERDLISSGRPPGAPSPHGKAGGVPWMRLIRSGSLWLDSFAQIGTNIGWVFLVTFLARYLDEVHHVEIMTRAWMASIPMIAGIVGMLFGGPLTDRLTAAVGLRWGRSLPIALTRFVAGLAYIGVLFTNDPWIATALFAVVAFFCDLGIAAIWAFKQDVGGRYVGSILGWGNMWGNLAASISAPLYNIVLDQRYLVIASTPGTKNWDAMFLMCAGAFFLAGIAGLGINATIPIAPPDEAHEDNASH